MLNPKGGKMKSFEAVTVVLITVVVLSLIGGMVHKFSTRIHHTKKEEFVGHDSPTEEVLEEISEAMTGREVDFTPESPEKE